MDLCENSNLKRNRMDILQYAIEMNILEEQAIDVQIRYILKKAEFVLPCLVQKVKFYDYDKFIERLKKNTKGYDLLVFRNDDGISVDVSIS